MSQFFKQEDKSMHKEKPSFNLLYSTAKLQD